MPRSKSKAEMEHFRVNPTESSSISSAQEPAHQSHLLLRTKRLSQSWAWIQKKVAGTGNNRVTYSPNEMW